MSAPRNTDPDMLPLEGGSVCRVHPELVQVLSRMNRKLNLIILALVATGVLMLGKEALAGVLARLAGG